MALIDPWGSIALDTPSEITLDACVQENYAGSGVGFSSSVKDREGLEEFRVKRFFFDMKGGDHLENFDMCGTCKVGEASAES